MLQFELTKKNAGVTIWGDTWELRAVYEFIHKIIDENPSLKDKESFVLSLAYEIRHAFDGMRKKDVRERSEDACPIYGFEVLWPEFVAQIGILRASMAFIPSNKNDQSIMFSLEYLVEIASQAAMPGSYNQIMYEMTRIGIAHEHVHKVIESRCKYFVGLSTRERLKKLPMILASLDPLYRFHAQVWENNGIKGVIPPSEFLNNSGEVD